jgi:hypothetical protein
MNVFEDLVIELKEENLLEEIFFENPSANGNVQSSGADYSGEASIDGHSFGNGSFASPEAVRTGLSQQIASMELVELVLSAVENANGKQNQPYDVLAVKKAFHRYSQMASDPESEDAFDSETEILAAIESWQHDLALRDEKIGVPAFRGYVESANPPLGPQALFAMVRFYRSLPISAVTIGKFDFVVTRLFSKFVDGERREMICSQQDAVKYLTQRYTDWSVDNFRSLPADDAKIAVPVSTFADIAAEAESASNFADLGKSKLFERLAELKEKTGASMFVPRVIAAAVDSNLRVAAHVIDLLDRERERHGAGISSRLSEVDFGRLSDAVARTFNASSGDLVDGDALELRSSTDAVAEKIRVDSPAGGKSRRSKKSETGSRSTIFGVNRWLLLATILTVVVSLGVYVWADRFADEPAKTEAAKVIDLEKPELKRYLTTSKLSGAMLYAVVTPAFEEMAVDVQREYLKSLYQYGGQKGYSKVTLMNGRGRNIGYADAERLEIGAR